MTDDTTTIEITEDQRDELKALKAHDRESYKAVIGRLLEGNGGDVSGDPTVDAKELADAVAGREVTLDATERQRIAQEVADALRE